MEKTYVFDGANSSNLESALVGSLMNGGMGGMNNGIWPLVYLMAFRGLFGDGYGNGNNAQLSQIQDTLNTNQGNTLLMDAIKGNQTAIGQLATTTNCNYNSVLSAINAVQSAICNVGNQYGIGNMQTINAINSGDAMLANQLASCCCDIKQLVTTQGYENRLNNERQSQLIQNGFSQVGYASAEQTCAIKQNQTDNTNRVIAKLDAMEDSRKDREIATLTAQLTAANSRAERAAELAPIYQALNDIKCKQPQTVTLPYSCATAVPTAMLYGGYGAYGAYGLPGTWS